MFIDQAFEQFLITLIGWAMGIAFGFIVSGIFAPLWKKIETIRDVPRLIILLTPWRTILAGCVLANLFPVVLVQIFGIGMTTGVISVALVIFIFTVIIIGETKKSPTAGSTALVRHISWIRSLAILSVVIATYYGSVGGGGLGFVGVQTMNTFMYKDAFNILWMILGISIFFDLAIGFVQYYLQKKAEQTT